MSVFTTVNTPELATFLQAYRAGELLYHEGIQAGVENTNYFVDTTAGRYVLTLFEKHEAGELDYFLGLMKHLVAQGLPVAEPVPDRNGNLLKVLHSKPAALIRRLPGETLEQPDAGQCAAMGTMLARLHHVGASWTRYRAPDRGHDWRMQAGQKVLPQLDPHTARILQEEIAFQQTLPFAGLPGGAIHADLFCDNVLFHAGHLSGVIDWYYACQESWLYDLAVVVNDWCCTADGHLEQQRLFALLAAYQSERPLHAIEREHWQGMLRAGALRFWLSRLLDRLWPRPGALVLQKDPQAFLQRLCLRRQEGELIRTSLAKAL
ncbi:MAG: homoserine kinase [Thiothrix sp.]|nr:homoserine kinase [Thiothrix sp.]